MFTVERNQGRAGGRSLANSEGHKILMNEFTTQDPTLPHINTIKCPNSGCESNTSGKEKDVIYLKYDTINMKFLYICNICNTQWRSKTQLI